LSTLLRVGVVSIVKINDVPTAFNILLNINGVVKWFTVADGVT
jgi:hypothetical protein